VTTFEEVSGSLTPISGEDGEQEIMKTEGGHAKKKRGSSESWENAIMTRPDRKYEEKVRGR